MLPTPRELMQDLARDMLRANIGFSSSTIDLKLSRTPLILFESDQNFDYDFLSLFLFLFFCKYFKFPTYSYEIEDYS